MLNSARPRWFCLIFYGSAEELKTLLEKYSVRISHYAYILHDKDIYADDLLRDDGTYVHKKGEIEIPHFHLLVSFYNGHTLSAVKKLFTTKLDKPRVEVITDKVIQYEYLIHKNDPDKYQYPKTDIVSDNLHYFEKMCIRGDKTDADEKAVSIVNDILAGVSPRIIMHRYGRDCIIHYKQYEDMADRIKSYDFDHRPIVLSEREERALERELEQLGIL